MKKTLLNIKIKSDNAARSFFHLFIMLVGFAALLGIIGTGQVILCHRDHPGRETMECLKGRR